MEQTVIRQALPVNTILNGRYLVGNVLGAGGFGITYMAQDMVSNCSVAIKEFMPEGMLSCVAGARTVQVHVQTSVYESCRTRFLEEARLLYCFRNNPNILTVYRLFEENGTAYYAMEYLDGMDLKQWMTSVGGKISWQELYPVIRPVMRALSELHNGGIVHRDISPDNIIVCRDGRVKLIDFGAARQHVRQKQMTVILKRKYAPIEQYETHGKQGPWTDVYALAATMYHCLTGVLPPEATNRVYEDTIMPFESFGVYIPVYVAKAIYRGLQIRRDARFQTMQEFEQAITAPAMGEMPTPSMQLKQIQGVQGYYCGQLVTIQGVIVLGRNPAQCTLCYPANAGGVSGVHCQLRPMPDGNGIGICDLGSSYGTYVNGNVLVSHMEYRITTGDTISFGDNQVWMVI